MHPIFPNTTTYILLLVVSTFFTPNAFLAYSSKLPSMNQEKQQQQKSSANKILPLVFGWSWSRTPVAEKCPRQMDCFCGVSSAVKRVNTKIVGGHEAVPHSYPWMVSLVDEFFEPFCGGVLINDRYILTAGHCTPNIDVETTKLILGHHDMSDLGPTARIYSIDSFVAHEQYSESDPHQKYDIALVKVKGGVVTFNEYINPICLPSRWTPRANFSSLIVAGWGQLAENLAPPEVLMEAVVPEYPITKCAQVLRAERVTPNHICAGNKTRDTCSGDSGGPLMLPPYVNSWTGNEFPAFTAIGVVSWGISCGNPVYPGVFTRVWSYGDWIMDHTPDGNYCNNLRPYSFERHPIC